MQHKWKLSLDIFSFNTSLQILMQIIIERKFGSNFQMVVGEEDTIGSIKMRIYRKLGIAPSHQRLMFQGEELMQDGKTISDNNIQDWSIIHLSIWSTGYGAWGEI